MDLIAQEFYRLASLHTYIGWIAVGILLFLQVYRSPRYQEKIPDKYRWDNLSMPRQHAILILLAGIGGAMTAASADASLADALKAALAAAQTLILTNLLIRR
jgi:hypothetical protein